MTNHKIKSTLQINQLLQYVRKYVKKKYALINKRRKEFFFLKTKEITMQ